MLDIAAKLSSSQKETGNAAIPSASVDPSQASRNYRGLDQCPGDLLHPESVWGLEYVTRSRQPARKRAGIPCACSLYLETSFVPILPSTFRLVQGMPVLQAEQ